MPPAPEKLRIDKYLWAIRIFKTRTLATAAIDEGKVKLAGVSVKASKPVSVGDRYEIRTPARKWVIEVTGLLQNRQAYEEAIKYYADLSTEEDKAFGQRHAPSFYTGKRMSKTGRPTKKERRGLSDLLSSDETDVPEAP
ncbi:MAG: RNA-binding S4 domain-containing protein [Sphingobacteriales bacterium]|nr:MAG: RNA-binding S4 domain-containing protein [Sphingobacteriales bacterium]